MNNNIFHLSFGFRLHSDWNFHSRNINTSLTLLFLEYRVKSFTTETQRKETALRTNAIRNGI